MTVDPHHDAVAPDDAGRAEIVREILVEAPVDLVFSYFTDPAKHVLWQGTVAEIDPRPGGRFRVTFGPGLIAVGAYVEVRPPTRLVYTWGWEEEGSALLPPGSSTVEVDLEARGDATLVRLRHHGLPTGMVELHAFGWDDSLVALQRAVAAAPS